MDIEKKYTVKEMMEVLKDIQIVNPYHVETESDGYGNFPDSYKFTEIGTERLQKEIEKEIEKRLK